jgi:ABC-type Mn2+/Zn2+ transport system ATPase subunit
MRMNLSNGAAPVLSARGIWFAYQGEPVLEDVGLDLAPGEFVALVGPNGSGKSTLVRVLVGLLAPRSGTVRLFGEPPDRLRRRWRIGYVPQRLRITPDVPVTVEEVVATGRLARQGWWRRARPADRDAVDHALESTALADLRRRPLIELSGGQQQRVLIAKALASEPDLLILDGAAVLLISHELGAVADDLDRVVVLKRRVVFDGPPAELAATGVSLGIHADDLPLWLEELA